MNDYKIFAGTANPGLAAATAGILGVRLGERVVSRFPDGEVYVRLEETVRGQDVFVIQPTSPPVDEHASAITRLVTDSSLQALT